MSPSVKLVGAARFELATSCSQNTRANQAALRPVIEESFRTCPLLHDLKQPAFDILQHSLLAVKESSDSQLCTL